MYLVILILKLHDRFNYHSYLAGTKYRCDIKNIYYYRPIDKITK